MTQTILSQTLKLLFPELTQAGITVECGECGEVRQTPCMNNNNVIHTVDNWERCLRHNCPHKIHKEAFEGIAS